MPRLLSIILVTDPRGTVPLQGTKCGESITVLALDNTHDENGTLCLVRADDAGPGAGLRADTNPLRCVGPAQDTKPVEDHIGRADLGAQAQCMVCVIRFRSRGPIDEGFIGSVLWSPPASDESEDIPPVWKHRARSILARVSM